MVSPQQQPQLRRVARKLANADFAGVVVVTDSAGRSAYVHTKLFAIEPAVLTTPNRDVHIVSWWGWLWSEQGWCGATALGDLVEIQFSAAVVGRAAIQRIDIEQANGSAVVDELVLTV